MIRTLAFLAIVASAFGNNLWGFGAHKLWGSGIHTKFDPIFGVDQHPWTEDDAIKIDYEKVEQPPAPLSSGYSGLTLYLTKSDGYRIGIYYDETKQICGVLILIPEDKVTPYCVLTKQGFKLWTYKSVNYYYIGMFFVSEDKQTRIASANSTQLIRDEYLTVQGLDGTVDKIPITATEIAAHPNWAKQACIPLMGQHYFYKMTPTLTCECENIYPWFVLTDEKTNQIIGAGILAIGKSDCDLELPSSMAVKTILTQAPQCIHDLVKKYEVFTLHVNFVDHPRLISC